ncbi:T9SS type A sorting domain-containing protein [bacterium]|nr:T9SS type A sorting domain-containing protein [bacterium]
MKKIFAIVAMAVVATVVLVVLTIREDVSAPATASAADRTGTAWYQGERARLATALAHAGPGSARAFKLQSKLDRLDGWAAGEARMDAPEEFARILYEMKIPDDRQVPGYAPGYRQRELARAKSAAGPFGKSLVWESRGPGNVAGRARTIVVDPDDPTGDTWFITSVGGGVWKTTDAGGSWTQLMDDQPLLAMQCLAMAASNTQVLYAGTGESYFNVDTMNGNGILKSVDKGATWTALASTQNDPRFNNVARIIVSPSDPDLVLAATTVGRYKSDLYPTTHIFRSTDGGATWAAVYTATNSGSVAGARVQQLLADPTDFAVQYATVHETGILKSTDGGQTWNPINTGITDFSGRYEMAISPVNPDYLYVSAEGATGARLWVSWNAGASWTAMSQSGSTNWLGGQGWYDNAIVCHPTDPTVVYVGGPQLYEIDINAVGGGSFSVTALASYSFPHPDHHWLEIVAPSGGGWYLLGTNDGGVTRTSSGVGGFTMPINGMVTTQFYGATKRPGASAYIGGMQDNGTWQSPVDPVATDLWDFRIGGDGYETAWHFNDPQKIMGGYQYNGLQRSLDGGATWSSATSGLSDTGSGAAPFITKIASSWRQPDRVFAVGAQGVWRSTNFGASWSLSPVTPGEWGTLSSFLDVRVSDADPDVIWAGSTMGSGGDIMVSTDGGLTFNPSADYTTATVGRISGLATHPTEPNTAYVLFSFAERPKIIKTTDGGSNWTDISGFGAGSVSGNGFPDVAVYDLLVWPNDPQKIWVGTEIGLVESLDGGATWALADNGLPAVGIWQLKAVEDEIVVATHGRGVWTTTDPALVDGQVFDPLFENMVQVPGGDLQLEFNLRSAYDSTQVWIDGAVVTTYGPNTPLQTELFAVPVLSGGLKTAYAVSYVGGLTYTSATRQADTFVLAAPVWAYANDLDDGGNLPVVNDGWVWTTPSGFGNPAYHTPHDYADGAVYTLSLMVPIKVAEISTLTFDEIAIVEPGEPGSVFGDSDFWDYVVVEGTADGTNWVPLAPGWDARDDAAWLTAFAGNQAGTSALWRNRTIELRDTFAAGEVVLLRWRLVADQSVNGWGWAVDSIKVTPSTTASGVGDTPRAVVLDQNYPNPFNPSTTIRFDLPRGGDVKLAVYDARGRLVRRLVDGRLGAGPQAVLWDGTDEGGRDAASGVYLYRLEAGDIVQQRKMTLIK